MYSDRNIHTKHERNIKKYEEKIEKIGLKHIVVDMMGEKINKNEAYELYTGCSKF